MEDTNAGGGGGALKFRVPLKKDYSLLGHMGTGLPSEVSQHPIRLGMDKAGCNLKS